VSSFRTDPLAKRLVKAGDGKESILLVEDEPSLRLVYAKMLSRLGYTVLVASDGEEAIGYCVSEKKIDLLLTDVMMPNKGGFELAREVRGIRPRLPIVFMSGYTDETLEEAGARVGPGFRHLQKPFDTVTLVAKLKEALEGVRVPT
jgi:CheY-like chemotaxis protein